MEISLRVYYEDTDAAGIVYYANYLRFIERGRTEFLRALGHDQHRLMKEGVAFAVRSVQAEYLKPARLDDLLTVDTTIAELGRAQLVSHNASGAATNCCLMRKYALPASIPARQADSHAAPHPCAAAGPDERSAMNVTQDLSIVELVLHASLVVKLVMGC
jgi:tol-pal system-associated acyl-CoA thioesterase